MRGALGSFSAHLSSGNLFLSIAVLVIVIADNVL